MVEKLKGVCTPSNVNLFSEQGWTKGTSFAKPPLSSFNSKGPQLRFHSSHQASTSTESIISRLKLPDDGSSVPSETCFPDTQY